MPIYFRHSLKKMKKYLRIINFTPLFLAFFGIQLAAQNVIWIDAAFDAPRLVKSSLAGVELLSKPLKPGTLPQGLALDRQNATFYWTSLNYARAQINRIPDDFSAVAVAVDSQSVLRGIAIDTVNEKLYWTATNLTSGPKIYRANFDGRATEVLLDFGPASYATPRAICLDVANGKMYWANFGEGKIQRADMLAGAAIEDVLVDLNGPTGLALDADSSKIFWTETNGGQIKCAELNGDNSTVVVSNLG